MENEPVMRSKATAEQVAAYADLSFSTAFGIDDTISLLKVRKVQPETPANELRTIELELGDQIAKKARVFGKMNAFMAGQCSMRPPTTEMMAAAKALAKTLDEMVAANIVATQIVGASTQLFKIWQRTEA